MHRPLSKDITLAKQLAERYNNIFNMIDIGLKLKHDVSKLIEELDFQAKTCIDIYEQYIKHKDVSATRMVKIRWQISVLKVLMPNDLKKLKMGILDGIRSKLMTLPKMNIQKYRVMTIAEVIKADVPLEDRQSIDTVNGYIKILNALLKFAYEREVVGRQFSVSLVKRITSARDERHALNADDLHKLMTMGNVKSLPIYKILYYSGMRLSEVYKCQINIVEGIKCFDLTDKTKQLKTKSSYRLIPVHNDIVEEVEVLWKQSQEVRAEYAGKQASKLFGTKGKTLYSLRHTFATELLNGNTGGAAIVSELLGHTHNDVTMGRYVKGFSVSTLKQAVDVLPSLSVFKENIFL